MGSETVGGAGGGTVTGAASWEDSGEGSSGASSSGSGGGGHGVLFPAGVLVGGRYLVVRFIARGGMGEVYEAEDVALRERIALKVVRSEVASDPRASERLKRELHLARKVSHPNVCRIYDLCFHELPATGETLPVLTMELLTGETLGARLRREGALPLDEALRVARQIAGALDAAHDQGIVHRDLKADNIFLVPGRRPGETRVVVTDFGLARGGDGPAITQGSGRLIGSPAYMAPEQVEGGAIGPAADLYAFGIVLYELVTGARPFEGDNVFEVALKRLQQAPEPPSRRRPDLPAAWEAAILRLLARKPADRFQAASEALSAMEAGPGSSRAEAPRTVAAASPAGSANAGPMPSTAQETPARRGDRLLELVQRLYRRLGWVGTAAVAALVLMVMRCTHVDLRHPHNESDPVAEPEPTDPPAAGKPAPVPPPPLPDPPAHLREAVAVIGFKNVSSRADKAWLGTAFQQMVTSELGVGEQLRLVSDESVARARGSIALSDEPSLAADTLRKLREVLGADYVVRGSYVAAGGGDKVHLDVVLQDARGGETIARVAEDGTEGDLSSLVARAGQKLRARLGVVVTPTEASAALARTIPASPEAERLYAEGLGHLHRWEANAARGSLEAAVVADKEFPLAHAALAEALLELGFEERARAEAKRANELSGRLGREQALSVEGRYHSVMGNKDEAVAVYSRLFRLHPDDLEHGLELAIAECNALHERDALATLEQLRRLPPPSGTDARIDLLTAHVNFGLGEYDRSRKMAQAAAGKARAQQNWTFVAEARLVEGRAAMMLGEPDAARPAMMEARSAYARVSDRRGLANVQDSLASLNIWVDDIAGAIAASDEELKVARGLGNRLLESRVLQWLAMEEMLRGNLPAARAFLEKRNGLESSQVAAGEKPHDEERQRLEGMMLAVEGQLDPSRRTWEALLGKYSEEEVPSQRAFVDVQLGMVLIELDEIDDATEHLREAERLSVKARDQRRTALARYYLAQAAMAEGRFADAERNARSAAEVFGQMKAPSAETASALLADLAQARQGRLDEALLDALPRLATLPRLQPFEWRLLASTVGARLLALAPAIHGAEAERLAGASLAAASRAGFVGMALESRLALAEVMLRRGNVAPAQALLTSLASEADTRGYARIERRAEELMEETEPGKTKTLVLRKRGGATVDLEGNDLSQLPRILDKVEREVPPGLGRDFLRGLARSSKDGKLRELIIEQEQKRRRAARKAGTADAEDSDLPEPPVPPGPVPPPSAPPAAPAPPAPPAPVSR